MASEARTVPDTFKHPDRINRIHNRAIVIQGKDLSWMWRSEERRPRTVSTETSLIFHI